MRLQSNIWKLQVDRFLGEFWPHIAILVPYLEYLGLKATDNFMIQAAYAASLLLCQVPTGYFSDIVGRRISLIISACLFPIGAAFFVFSTSFWGFVTAEIFLALAVSMRSGTDSAMMYDTLLELGREKEHKKIEGRAFLYQQIGTGSGNIIGALLFEVWAKLPFLLNLFRALLFLPLSLSLKEPAREKAEARKPHQHLADMGKVLQHCTRHADTRYIVLYMSLFTGFNIIGFWSYFIYYGHVGIPASLFGFVAAANSLIAGLGGMIAHKIEKKMDSRKALLLPLFMAPSYFLLGWIDSIWIVPLVTLNGFLWGFSVPIARDLLHQNTPSKIRATVMSVGEMGARLIYIVLAYPFGLLVDKMGIQTGLMMLGTLFVLGVSLPVIGLIRSGRRASASAPA
ncbi:MAG: MFS transporter [Proteobacteria bacterium]|jgi:MFS family permease|nr:MFS transporter [Alphaproteobacteria bacterium]NCC03953.1 MFS transporter [Pseudomonadota bacterium]